MIIKYYISDYELYNNLLSYKIKFSFKPTIKTIKMIENDYSFFKIAK